MAISFAGLSGGASKIQKVDKFTSSGTWVAPDDVTEAEIIVVGGGGGGAFAGSNNLAGQGGSGSLVQDFVAVTGGTSYTITVGSGGARVLNTAGDGGNGGSSSALGLTVIGGAGGQQISVSPSIGFGGGGSGGRVSTSTDVRERSSEASKGTFGLAGGGGSAFGSQVGVTGQDGGGGYRGNSQQNPLQNSGGGGLGHGNQASQTGATGVVIIKYWTAL